jgi:hypothetical protein
MEPVHWMQYTCLELGGQIYYYGPTQEQLWEFQQVGLFDAIV